MNVLELLKKELPRGECRVCGESRFRVYEERALGECYLELEGDKLRFDSFDETDTVVYAECQNCGKEVMLEE